MIIPFLITAALVTISILPTYRRLLRPLLSSSGFGSLQFSCTRLTRSDVTWAFFLLVLRSVGQMIRLWPSYTVKKSETSSQSTLAIDGSELVLVMPCSIDKEDFDAFSKSIGTKELQVSQHPSLMMLFVSAVTEPAMLLLLAKKQCPIKALGSVNVWNRFDVINQKAVADFLSGKLTGLVVIARLSQQVRVKKRGYEYSIVVGLIDPASKETENGVIFKQTFAILQFEKHGLSVMSEETDSHLVNTNTSTGSDDEVNPGGIEMTPGDPLLWAALCKDYNPIHTSSIAAKLFGMPGKIAHGNHVVAKAVAEAIQEGKLGASQQRSHDGLEGNLWMEVYFKRPVKVPSQLEVHSRTIANPKTVDILNVTRNEKIHVEVRSGRS